MCLVIGGWCLYSCLGYDDGNTGGGEIGVIRVFQKLCCGSSCLASLIRDLMFTAPSLFFYIYI